MTVRITTTPTVHSRLCPATGQNASLPIASLKKSSVNPESPLTEPTSVATSG